MNKSDNRTAREISLGILMDTLENGKLSHLALRDALGKSGLDKTDKAFVTILSEGTIERMITIDYIIDLYSKVKVKKLKPVIREIMRMSVYQIMYLESVPDSAACNEAVKLVKKRGFQGLSGFVNGVLRKICREKENVIYLEKSKDLIKYYSVKYSVPEFVIKSFIDDYGEDITVNMLHAINEDENHITIRVNTSKISMEELEDSLLRKNIEVEKSELVNNALYVKNMESIGSMKEFSEGMFQIQDISSMLPAKISGIKKGDICIDMCAAPGGKTMHLAELSGGEGKIYSRDVNEYKTGLILENIKRTGYKNVVVQIKDGTVFYEEDKEIADIVIADVPCSGMGVFKKKTDIKYNISKDGIEELAELSRKILGNAVGYLKPGGTLIFSTCTVNKIENDRNRKWLMDEFGLEPVDFSDLLTEKMLKTGDNEINSKNGFLQLFITKEYDGFYIAKFRKK